ncbi:CopG family transcriptional regulator [Candidatus Bathyarchaeota archaeon ex4484_135]|nr:MAG: CopG family transcriptional regulator [Candidatus Bathyarchaeota archaeon ex4484_135]
MGGEKVAVYIPRKLYERIEKAVRESGGEFKNVEEYVTFVLEEVLKEEEGEAVFTPEEEEEIKKRLRALGYL